MNALKKITATSGLAKAAQELAAKGQRGDTEIVHASKGDLFFPRERIDPEIIEFAKRKLGKDLPRFVVGSPYTKKNSATGLEAFEDGGDSGGGDGGGSDSGGGPGDGGDTGGVGADEGGSGAAVGGAGESEGMGPNPFAPPPAPPPAPAPAAAAPPAPYVPPNLNPAAITGVATAPTSVPATTYNSNALLTYMLGGGQAPHPLQTGPAPTAAGNATMPLYSAPPGAPGNNQYLFGMSLQNALSGLTNRGNIV